ncbi:hypothetical protein CHS0354_018755 [Potamilus streckersoni]|uniref:Protein kinase domain-containing protein n=1 Tax=Potamilus streckersoni TaxID=2493646 RepID=A0AAE0T3F6_9BIVA|nr:hypothetical protein CHS0354_018755 [Potamilus streckersoni]
MTTARKGSAEKGIPHMRLEDDSMIWDTYECGRKLGQGSFGKVYLAKHKSSGQQWAIKAVNKEKAGSSAIKLLEREVLILKRVNHENIISLNEVFETSKRMYLVMELCEGGELADALKERKYFPESEVKKITKKLASAITYLHKHDIVHRDLKLENILLSQNPNDPEDKLHIKVTDFGLSVVKGVGYENMMQDFCGTPNYMSPEIIDNKTYSQQCDIWAMGVIVFTLLCGNFPFRSKDKDEDSLFELIKKGQLDFSDEIWNDVSADAKKCIEGMLKVDPAHRYAASEVLSHQWLTGVSGNSTNVLEMMKAWTDLKIKKDEGETSLTNGDIDDTFQEETTNDAKSERESTPSEHHTDSKQNGPEVKNDSSGRRGSGGVTGKPGSGRRSQAGNITSKSAPNQKTTGISPKPTSTHNSAQSSVPSSARPSPASSSNPRSSHVGKPTPNQVPNRQTSTSSKASVKGKTQGKK